MEDKEEATYSEIIELSTFSKEIPNMQSNPLYLEYNINLKSNQLMNSATNEPSPKYLKHILDSKVLSENRATAVLNPFYTSHTNDLQMSSNNVRFIADSIPNMSNGLPIRTFSHEVMTYKRGYEIENQENSKYKNVTAIQRNSELFSSTDGIVSCDNVIDISPPLCKRLKMYKTRMGFKEYAYCAMEWVFKEVEKIAILDFIYLIFSVGISTVGFMHLDGCKACTLLPVMMVVCGIMDSIANLIGFSVTLKDLCTKEIYFRDVVRGIRALTFFLRLVGLFFVYNILPPEECNVSDVKYCNTCVYWISFAYFHLFTLISVTTLLAMIIAALSYYFLN